MGNPAFIVYKLMTLLFGAKPVEVPLVNYKHDLDRIEEAVTSKTRMVLVPSPNNPTGTGNAEEELRSFARRMPAHVIVVFDEAYAEYLEDAPDLRPLIAEGCNVVCLRTFSKIYGLAAMRVGYGYANESLAALLNGQRPDGPVLWFDPADGSVALAVSHANGAVLRAARIGALANADEILISRQVSKVLDASHPVDDWHSEQIKGFDQPVEVGHLTWRTESTRPH